MPTAENRGYEMYFKKVKNVQYVSKITEQFSETFIKLNAD
jgi:hypothetical protein